MVNDARGGNLTTRARLARAHHVHVARIATGQETEDDATLEAVAGGLLEAETAHNIQWLRNSYEHVHSS